MLVPNLRYSLEFFNLVKFMFGEGVMIEFGGSGHLKRPNGKGGLNLPRGNGGNWAPLVDISDSMELVDRIGELHLTKNGNIYEANFHNKGIGKGKSIPEAITLAALIFIKDK